MAQSELSSEESPASSPCGQGSSSQIIYAWARDAPPLVLPDGVGFKVGKDSPIKYIVLQVHYAHIDKFKGNTHYLLNYCIETLNSTNNIYRWINGRFGHIYRLHFERVSNILI